MNSGRRRHLQGCRRDPLLADTPRHFRFMEVCGGHTHAIYRFGLKDLLPPNIELVHGPGCPVCVLPMGRIDDGLSMTRDTDVIFKAFGERAWRPRPAS
jgi:hydrogenase expression/formation protein HypD